MCPPRANHLTADTSVGKIALLCYRIEIVLAGTGAFVPVSGITLRRSHQQWRRH